MLLPCYDVLSNNLRTKASILKWSYGGTGLLRSSVAVCPIAFCPLCQPAVCYASKISHCCGWLGVLQQPVCCLSAKADSLWEGLWAL